MCVDIYAAGEVGSSRLAIHSVGFDPVLRAHLVCTPTIHPSHTCTGHTNTRTSLPAHPHPPIFPLVLPLYRTCRHYETIWGLLCGGRRPNCRASVMMSERENGDRVKTLGFMMKENNTFDGEVDLQSVLELYFSTCATSMSTEMLAVAAATLANAGANPLTESRVFKEETVRSVLSLMLSCGMNSESGSVFPFFLLFSVGMLEMWVRNGPHVIGAPRRWHPDGLVHRHVCTHTCTSHAHAHPSVAATLTFRSNYDVISCKDMGLRRRGAGEEWHLRRVAAGSPKHLWYVYHL